MTWKIVVGAVVILGLSVYEGYALQCWTCSSDIDRSCADMFNTSDILRFGGGYLQSSYQSAYNQQPYDPYNQRQYDNNRDYSTYRNENYPSTTQSYSTDPNYRGSNYRDDYRHPDDRGRDRGEPDKQYDGRDSRYRDQDYRSNYNSRRYNESERTRDGLNRYYNSSDPWDSHYRGNEVSYRNGSNNTRDHYNDRDRYNQDRDRVRYNQDRDRDRYNQDRGYDNRDYNNRDLTTRDPNRDRYYDNRGDYNNRDPNNRNPNNRDANNRDFDRDRDYRNRDYNPRDPNSRDPYYDRDRSRDPYNNRDYNSRDGNRDPYYDRDHRDPYNNRDPNNRDYPPRDYGRDYNQQSRSYDPSRDVNYQRAQAQIASSQSGPRLVTCNEEEARLRRLRNVCIKKVQRIGEYQLTYIRRCEAIPFEKQVGTCYDAVARGISLDFCEYCEYDGCNSATGLKFNIFLASLVPLVLLLSFK